MAKQSGLLKRQQDANRAYARASKETYVQFICDMYALALNDPEVMGSDTLGEKRLVKVSEAVGRYYDMFHEALEGTKESDVYQERLDKRMKQIFKTRFVPFKVRYDFVIPPKYKK